MGYHACLEIVPIFRHLSLEELGEVAAITVDRGYDKGAPIYRAGEGGGELYILHAGRVKVYRLSADGKEQVLRIVGAGEFLGELSLFSPKPRADYAEALEPCTMCVIAWPRLRALMERIPSVAFKVLEQLSGRLERTEAMLEEANLSPVERRLAKYLLEASAGRREFDLDLSKGDLASLLGMTQETLSRRLAALQQDEAIELRGRRGIVIRDRESLEAAAEGPY